MPTNDTINNIYDIVSNPRFINMEGLSGEIPFWVAPYNISKELKVESEIKHLVRKLKTSGFEPLCIDLFELSCEIIEEKIGMEELKQIELDLDKSFFLDALQSTINIHDRFIPAIGKKVKETNPQMLFLKGVGKVYPFIRSHIVLNNLQSEIKNIPTLMFYPGEYSGRSLRLFNLLEDDNYYRAFNIYTYKL
ncbi:MAG TPA: DUF1788 domain-containing protein [Porphyromonadaceae bacterium]|jgi:hypothetical protein|nr:DUF1788 domain-containing protein [Porphyromonadaceae bacterium]